MKHLNWHEMFVREFGDRESRGTLLFIHGLGESGLCFESLCRMSELREWRCLVPDLPSYGRSPWPGEPYSFEELVQHLTRWLDYTGEGEVFLVGHSMGGVLAQLFAESDPGRVRALVVVDGNVSAADCVFSGRAAEDSEIAFLEAGFAGLMDEVYRTGIEDTAHRGYYASMRLCDPWAFFRHSVELVQISEEESLAGRMASMPLPALYIAGSPGGASGRTLELLRSSGARLEVIEPAGHWPFIDRPEDFLKTLLSFLDEIA